MAASPKGPRLRCSSSEIESPLRRNTVDELHEFGVHEGALPHDPERVARRGWP